MVYISDVLIPSVDIHFELTLDKVKKITPLSDNDITTTHTKFTDKDGKEQIKTETTFSGTIHNSSEIGNMFLDFIASLFNNTVKVKTQYSQKLHDSSKRVSMYKNVDLDDMQEQYEDEETAKIKLTELEICLKEIIKKIGESDVAASTTVLEQKKYLPEGQKSIFTTTLLEQMMKNKIKFDTISNMSEMESLLEEDYKKTKTQQDRIDNSTTTNEKTETSNEEVQPNKKTDNRIMNAIDKSEPIYNPKVLWKHTFVNITKNLITIKVEVHDYLREMFLNANLGDMDITDKDDANVFSFIQYDGDSAFDLEETKKAYKKGINGDYKEAWDWIETLSETEMHNTFGEETFTIIYSLLDEKKDIDKTFDENKMTGDDMLILFKEIEKKYKKSPSYETMQENQIVGEEEEGDN